MISDVLSEAVERIREYQRELPDVYGPWTAKINKVAEAMKQLQRELDTPPCPDCKGQGRVKDPEAVEDDGKRPCNTCEGEGKVQIPPLGWMLRCKTCGRTFTDAQSANQHRLTKKHNGVFALIST